MNRPKRLIASVVIIDSLVIQSFNYHHFLPIGKIKAVIENLDRWGVDEIHIISIENKNNLPNYKLLKLIKEIKIHTPIIYSGGISTLKDAINIFNYGVDRIGLESLVFNEDFKTLHEIYENIGTQSIILNLPLMIKKNKLKLYNYRTKIISNIPNTFLNLIKKKIFSEIMVIDYLNQGMPGKFNLNILKKINIFDTKIIVSGGVNEKIINQIFAYNRVSAVCIENILYYKEHAYQKILENTKSKYFRKAYFHKEIKFK